MNKENFPPKPVLVSVNKNTNSMKVNANTGTNMIKKDKNTADRFAKVGLSTVSAPSHCTAELSVKKEANIDCTTSEGRTSSIQAAITYLKRRGTAALGQFYEVKLLTMVLFRLLHDDQVEDFYLGTNLDEAGAFDDVVLRIRVEGKSRIFCLQAKHKSYQHFVNYQDVINIKDAKGDFNLRKYFESYLNTVYMPWQDHAIFQTDNNTEQELIIFTPAVIKFPNYVAIEHKTPCDIFQTLPSGKSIQLKCTENLLDLYTTVSKQWHSKQVSSILAKLILLHKFHLMPVADALKELQTNNVLKSLGINKMCSRNILQLSNNEEVMAVSLKNKNTICNEIANLLEPLFLPSQEEHTKLVNGFFENLRFYTKQATEDQLEEIIRQNIKAEGYENDEMVYSKSYAKVELHWKHFGQVAFLTKNCKYFEMTANELELEKLHVIGKSKINNNLVQFNTHKLANSAWANFHKDNLTKKSFFMNIFTSTPIFSCSKVIQYFQEHGTEYKCISNVFKTLQVLESVKPKCFIVAMFLGPDNEIIKEIRQRIDKLIIITKNKYGDDCRSFVDETSLSDFEFKIQEKLLKSNVLFQGSLVLLKSLINQVPISLLDAITLEKLINGETLAIHNTDSVDEVVDSSENYIDRKLLNSKQQTFEPKSIKDKVVLVAADPGMGKSTSLKRLVTEKKNENPLNWIVIINLLDCSNQFDKWVKNSNTLDNEQVINFLMNHLNFQESDSSSDYESFERKLFRSYCNQKKIFFLFDSFDEISPDYTNMAIKVIQICNDNFACYLWVATRFGDFQKELEKNLGVTAYTLKPLEKKEAIMYLCRIDINESNLSEDNVNRLLSNLPQSTRHGENDLISMPLQLQMIAEIIKCNLETFCSTYEKIDSVTLYEKFTDLKFDVWLKKNTNINTTILSNKQFMNENKKKCIENYRLAAICSLLNAKETEIMLSKTELKAVHEFLQCVKSSVDRTGFIVKVVNGKAKFVHQTLAEYFFAQFLWEKYSTLDDNELEAFVHEIIIKCLILKERFQVLKFLEEISSKNMKKSLDFSYKATVLLKQLLNCLPKSRHEFDRQVFCYALGIVEHSIIIDDTESIIEFKKCIVHRNRQILLLKAAELGYLSIVCLITQSKPGCINNSFDWLNGWTALHYAAKGGHINIVEHLLNASANVHRATKENGQTALHIAAERGDLRIVELLLDKGANVNSALTNTGITPLHLVARKGFTEIVKLLLAKGAEIDSATTVYGQTALHFASGKGYLEIVQLLIKYGGNVKIKTKNKSTPLHLATRNDHYDVVRELLQNGANPNNIAEENLQKNSIGKAFRAVKHIFGNVDKVIIEEGWTPLHSAAQNNNVQIASLLLDNGADIDITDTLEEQTPLLVATKEGFFEMVRFLIIRGANVNFISRDKRWTALHWAAFKNFKEIVGLLLKSGAMKRAISEDEKTALDVAREKKHTEIEQLLLSENIRLSEISSEFNIPHNSIKTNYQKIKRKVLEERYDVDLPLKCGDRTPLMKACLQGSLKEVQVLIDEGANVNLGNIDISYTPLHCAALKNFPKIIRLLVEKGANIDCTTSDEGRTPLFEASLEGAVNAVEILLELGANTNRGRIDTASTPLHCAAQNNFPEIIKLLVEKGANIDCTTSDEGRTPLYQASVNGSFDAVKILLELGANTNLGKTDNAYTPLHCAAQKNFPEIIKLLVEKGANIDCTTSDEGRTPLFEASIMGAMDTVKVLLELGANTNLGRIDTASTPLHCAAEQNFPEIIKLLVENGANIDCTTSDIGRTPLFQASIMGAMDAVKVLLELGANTSLGTTDNAYTPLHCAAQKNFPEIIKLLVENGANIDCTTSDIGRTPLFQASIMGAMDAVKVLLELGANTSLGTTDNAYTPLHCAAQNNFPEIIKLLVEKGANIDCTTSDDSRTALHVAAKKGHSEVVQLLLNFGADKNIASKPNGDTPHSLATRGGFEEIVEMLSA